MLKVSILVLVGGLLLLPSTLCKSMALSKRNQVQVCGRLLTDTLNLLCNGEYYDPEEEIGVISERDAPAGVTGVAVYPYRHFEIFPLRIPGAEVQSLPTGRKQRGVVDECCKKSCSTSILYTYCRNGKK